jgi:hypothetical protein
MNLFNQYLLSSPVVYNVAFIVCAVASAAGLFFVYDTWTVVNDVVTSCSGQ